MFSLRQTLIRPNAFRLVALAFAAILLSACASGLRVQADSDPRADFSTYRSFAFYEPLALETRGYTTLLSARLKDEARRQMEARGYVYDESAPDLRVNLNAYVVERTDVVSVPRVDYGYYYSYRARGYIGFPIFGDHTQALSYTEGTVNVDLVDAREKRLVWEGIAVGTTSARTPAERRDRAGASVIEIFEAFPHRAGLANASTP